MAVPPRRWESRTEALSYTKLAVLKFFGMIYVTCHWTACLWRLVVNFELDRGTMTDPEYKKVLARDEARTKKIMDEGGPNPYLGPQFNAI